MLPLLGRRLILSIPTLFGVLVVVFLLLYIAPGDPVQVSIRPDQRRIGLACHAQHLQALAGGKPVQLFDMLVVAAAEGAAGGPEHHHHRLAGRLYDTETAAIQQGDFRPGHGLPALRRRRLHGSGAAQDQACQSLRKQAAALHLAACSISR